MGTHCSTLKASQSRERDSHPDNLRLRVRGALSLLNRTEQEADPDSCFMFLWIAFNTTYVPEIDGRRGLSEQGSANEFLKYLHHLDHSKRLAEIAWHVYSNAFCVLLGGHDVLAGSGENKKGRPLEDHWKMSFPAAKRPASYALATQGSLKLVAVVGVRIYILLNQLLPAVNQDDLAASWGRWSRLRRKSLLGRHRLSPQAGLRV